MMISPAKVLIYLIELINCYAAIYYSNFLFFYLQRTFGFGEKENLLTAALGGFVYIIAVWQGGKWAERFGCIRMLYMGCFGVILSLAMGLVFIIPTAQVMVFCLWTVGICFIWPALETVTSDRAGVSLSKILGIYNVTWAAGGAIAYFTGGIVIEKLGMASVFWLPLGLTVVELALLPVAAQWLKKENDRQCPDETLTLAVSPEDAKRFLRMAWLANPFAYVAINTVIPLVPSIAEKLHLSTGMAGMFIGPAFGAATLYLVPAAIGIGAWSVGGLLCAGFSGLLFVRHYRIKS